MIEATGLTKKYGPLTAIDNVSFRINPGEVAGLLGPNGAGKTTTMRILTGFMPPTEGVVRIAGVDILDEPIAAKKKLGYLPESPPLYPELTVEESLRFVAGLQGMKNIGARLEEVMTQTGIDGVRHRLVRNISKGYRQRVGIAQALIHNPSVLILDEPTIGLDPKQILELRDLIRSLREGRAILLSSHILQEITSLCDRILIIHRGKIVAERSRNGLTTEALEALFLDAVAH